MVNKHCSNLPLLIEGKIFVCCPGGSVTGGPELLHQLVDCLRHFGHDAYITYYPFEKSYSKPPEYEIYNSPVETIEDDSRALIVIPEVFTKHARKIKNAQIAIWWLSVDNYYGRNGQSWIRDLKNRISTLLQSRIPLWSMRNLLHFTQSLYAREFLRRNGIDSKMLTDYLAVEHFENITMSANRRDIVVYNPKKGAKKTALLIEKYPEIEFIPIKNMTKMEVAHLLSTAKIYIDFGVHPGKDRIPREAAIAGCCIITGICGAAGNNEDVLIPNNYKLDDKSLDYIISFGPLVKSIFSDYEKHSEKFEVYRNIIREEPNLFKRQVIEIFGVK